MCQESPPYGISNKNLSNYPSEKRQEVTGFEVTPPPLAEVCIGFPLLQPAFVDRVNFNFLSATPFGRKTHVLHLKPMNENEFSTAFRKSLSTQSCQSVTSVVFPSSSLLSRPQIAALCRVGTKSDVKWTDATFTAWKSIFHRVTSL